MTLETVTLPSGWPESHRDMVEEYAASRPRSRSTFEQACQVMPGGQTRTTNHFEPFPTVIERGSGQILVDIDGHEYLDVVNNYTSLIHGNAFGPASAAVRQVLDNGTAFSSVHPAQIELAREILDRIRSADLVRFTHSGGEATALAVAIARNATGRREIVIADGGFHGSLTSIQRTDPDVVSVPFNDLEALSLAVTDRTAAVVLEPFQGAGGVIPGDADYLRHAQSVAADHNAVFVLDEIQSLRNSLHGVQEPLGLKPDLTLLGKIIGGGFPIGAVAGRADLLNVTAPYAERRFAHSGTYNGHLAAAVAGRTTLDHLDAAAIERLTSSAAELADTIESAARAAGLDVHVSRAGSIMNVHPLRVPLTADEAAKPQTFHRTLHLALLLEGVYATPRGMLNLSTVLTKDDLAEVGSGYARAFERISVFPELFEDLEH